MKKLILYALAGSVMLTAVSAQDQLTNSERRFEGVNDILIENFTGRLEVSVGGNQTRITMQQGDASFQFEAMLDGETLSLAGEDRPQNYDLHREINWRRYGDNAFSEFLEDYPVLKIAVPEGVAIELDDAITIASIGNLNGALIIGGGYVDAVVGDVTSAKVSVHSAGDISLGEVRDTLIASIHGSGDITAESASASALSIHGSGDISIGDISGDAKLKIHGSGDIDTGNIDGEVLAAIHGSGDISSGKVTKGGDIAIYGSGDISMRSINGPVEASINGSGNIEIADGRAENLKVSLYGSGDFIFNGVSSDLIAHIRGSGNVEIARNIGSLKTSGRGDIRINGRWIEIDD